MRYQKIIKQDVLPGRKKQKQLRCNRTDSPPNIELLLYAGIALNFTCLNEHIKHKFDTQSELCSQMIV